MNKIPKAECEQIAPRFWSKTEVTWPSKCWNWRGPKYHFGHGVFAFRRKPARAHRISWIIANGEIPEGQLVLHKCDNPACVNPNHLYLGSSKDNNRDMVNRGRQYTRKGIAYKFTFEIAKKIRARYKAEKISCEKLAREYNVSYTTMNLLLRGKTWSETKDYSRSTNKFKEYASPAVGQK